MSDQPKEKMSRKDEIMSVLKKHQKTGTLDTPLITCGEYNSIATEIEKIFDEQQKALLEIYKLPDRIYRRDGKWSDIHSAYCAAARIARKVLDDQIIEE